MEVVLTTSILTSIKKLLGVPEDMIGFDTDIIMYINSVISMLPQLTSGVTKGFFVADKTDTWSALLADDSRLELIKTYIFLKVKVIFDPPATAALLDATNKMITEHEFRIGVFDDQMISEAAAAAVVPTIT